MNNLSQWESIAEVGSMAAMRWMAFIHRLGGRRLSLWALYPISAYFYWRRPVAQETTVDYLNTLRAWAGEQVFPRHPCPRDTFHHILSFAINLYDRMVAWGGGFPAFSFEHSGSEHLFRLAAEKKGGILLGAHIGSFDMPRILAGRHGVVLNVLMYTDHAARISSFFERLDPSSSLRVLRIDPHSAQTGFAIKACLERGEFVGILADRVPPGSSEEVAVVDFLGRPARFPLSPYRLACTLGSPLLTSMCVRVGDRRYRAAVEVLTEGEQIPRRNREERSRELLSEYVQTLEEHCRRWPLQWFNFFDFWAANASEETLEQSVSTSTLVDEARRAAK